MKRIFSVLFKVILLVVAVYGLVLAYQKPLSVLEISLYFTTFSMVITIMMYGFLMMKDIFNRPENLISIYFRQALIATLIFVSMVYSFVLIPYLLDQGINYPIWSLEDVIIHYIVPILVIFDYVFFYKKGHFNKIYLGGNILILIIYGLFLGIYISLGGRFYLTGNASIFPYFFFNYPQYGIPLVLIAIALIFLVSFLFAWITYTLDHILGVRLTTNYKRK